MLVKARSARVAKRRQVGTLQGGAKQARLRPFLW